MSTEAQKRASRKYYTNHKEYYNKKTKEEVKKVRKERKEYKARINEAIEYIHELKTNCEETILDKLLDILQGSDNND